MKEYLAITKALSDASRVRMLCALHGGELCVCQLIELLQLAPSTVSKHLSVLSQADLVESRKNGRWVYYRLPATRDRLVRGAIRWIQQALARDGQVLADAKAVEAVRRIDKQKLCESYKRP